MFFLDLSYNDIHLIKCAKGSDCSIIVTKDEDLIVSDECKVHILTIEQFYDYDIKLKSH